MAGSGGDATEKDQLKRAEAAKNKYSAQKASQESDSGTEQSLPTATVSSVKEAIDYSESPPVNTTEDGDIIGQKETLSTPSLSFGKSDSSASTESDTSTLDEAPAEIKITTVKAVKPATISDQSESLQETELLVETAPNNNANDTLSLHKSDSSADTESESSTSGKETAELEMAPAKAVTPATIPEQIDASPETELSVQVASMENANDTSHSRADSPDSELDERTREEAKLKAEMEVIQEKLKVFEIARKKAEADAKEKAAEASRLREAMKAKQLAAQEAQEKRESEKVNKIDKQVSAEETLENSKVAQSEKDLFKKFASDVSSMFRDLQK